MFRWGRWGRGRIHIPRTGMLCCPRGVRVYIAAARINRAYIAIEGDFMSPTGGSGVYRVSTNQPRVYRHRGGILCRPRGARICFASAPTPPHSSALLHCGLHICRPQGALLSGRRGCYVAHGGLHYLSGFRRVPTVSHSSALLHCGLHICRPRRGSPLHILRILFFL